MEKTQWSFGHSECNRVKVYRYTSMIFSTNFAKRNNFYDYLFAFLDEASKKEEITPQGANSFFMS